jgi:hypothetical protein
MNLGKIPFSDGAITPAKPMRDKDISWAARGLLAYLYTVEPIYWDTSVSEKALLEMAPSSRDHLRKIVRELLNAGYLVKEADRSPDGRMAGMKWRLPLPSESI